MTFKMLKRRYRSSEENEKLRRLDYFNQPFEVGNEIKLQHDVDLDKPLALESLSTQFEAADEKRGKQNVMKREEKKKKKNTSDDDDFGAFDFEKSMNY